MTATVDNSVSLVLQPFIFKHEEWEILGNGTPQEPLQIKGVPGTWMKPTETLKWCGANEILAFFCCPACGNISALHPRVHTISEMGKLINPPSLVCMYKPDANRPHAKCSFHRVAYFDRWNRKPLWAIAIERTGPKGQIKAEMHYTHADNEREARMHNFGPGARIVACGLAIAYFVEDKKGEILSAD